MDQMNCQDFIFTWWFVCKKRASGPRVWKTCFWWVYFGEEEAGALKLHSCNKMWDLVYRWNVSSSWCSACYWQHPGYCGILRGQELSSAVCVWCWCSLQWCWLCLLGNNMSSDEIFFFSSYIFYFPNYRHSKRWTQRRKRNSLSFSRKNTELIQTHQNKLIFLENCSQALPSRSTVFKFCRWVLELNIEFSLSITFF